MNNHFHFIGIGGIGMSGLAHIAVKKGFKVSGSDIATNANIESLKHLGVTIFNSHMANQVNSSMTIVYSTDIKGDNPEFQASQQLGCRLWHRSDMLNFLLNGKISLAVTGTHGKTTTSSLLANLLVSAKKEPSFAVGGILREFNTNAAFGTGEHFVLEADESDRSFLKYSPHGAIVTNVDADHLEYYQYSMDNLKGAFKEFCDQVQEKDLLFWCHDDEVLAAIQPSQQSYGEHPHSRWRVANFTAAETGIQFDLHHGNNCYKAINLALKGRHNALNGAAIFGMGIALGIDEMVIRQLFKKFQGVKRRCEIKADVDGMLFIDDYAHHPTEIVTTLEGLKKAYPKRRFLVVFQPHRYSRTQNCLGMYGTIFNACDYLFFTDIFSAGENPIDGLTVQKIISEVSLSSSLSYQYAPRHNLAEQVNKSLSAGDLVVSLGAGDITKITDEILALRKARI